MFGARASLGLPRWARLGTGNAMFAPSPLAARPRSARGGSRVERGLLGRLRRPESALEARVVARHLGGRGRGLTSGCAELGKLLIAEDVLGRLMRDTRPQVMCDSRSADRGMRVRFPC